MSDFLEPPKRRKTKFKFRVSPNVLADYLSGQLEARRAKWRAEWKVHGSNRARARNAKERQPRPRYVPWRKTVAPRQRLLALPGWRVLIARMAAGHWYGVPTMYKLCPEYAAKTVRAWLPKAL